MNRNNKLSFIALATLMTLSGCGGTKPSNTSSTNSNAVVSESSIMSVEETTFSLESSTEETISSDTSSSSEYIVGYNAGTNSYTSSCESNPNMGFVTATAGPSGTINMDDPVTFKVFFGRADECEINEIDDNGGSYYDKYKDCEFYLDESILFQYLDKRGWDSVRCYDNNLEHVDTFALPNLMDPSYVSKKVSVKGVGKTISLTHYIEISIDIAKYKSYFYDAEGWYVGSYAYLDRAGQKPEIELEQSVAWIFLNIRAYKDGEEIPMGMSCKNKPGYVLEDDDFYLKYGISA